jgi:hypothetical protein
MLYSQDTPKAAAAAAALNNGGNFLFVQIFGASSFKIIGLKKQTNIFATHSFMMQIWPGPSSVLAAPETANHHYYNLLKRSSPPNSGAYKMTTTSNRGHMRPGQNPIKNSVVNFLAAFLFKKSKEVISRPAHTHTFGKLFDKITKN